MRSTDLKLALEQHYEQAKADGHAIEFYALLITHNKKASVIYIEADADTPKDETEKLTKILASLKPAE